MAFNADHLREYSTAASFERGYDYYRLGQVEAVERCGDMLFAQAYGTMATGWS